MNDESTPSPAAEQAILFADISDSALIYAVRGDAVGFALTSGCLGLMQQQVELTGGRLVKRLGDAVLAVFETTHAALGAAVGMQRELDQPGAALRGEGIHVRVGISRGPVVADAGDVYGDVVNVASRLVSYAGADEIFLSQHAYDDLPASLRDGARLIDQVVLRNRPSWVQVYEFLWKQEDVTVPSGVGLRSAANVLAVTFGSQQFIVTAERPKLRIGRAPDNDIVIEGDVVSRYHAEIALRGDKFFLSDASTNGTYLHGDGDEVVRVLREDVTLGVGGHISPGAEGSPRIHYRVEIKG